MKAWQVLAGMMILAGTHPAWAGEVGAQVKEVSAQQAQPLPALPAARPLLWKEIFQKGDRVLFLGDETTQQMTYTRAAATAILSLRPRDQLRFYNGGFDGASATSALTWIDDLLSITRPQVVFICFGLNDVLSTPALEQKRGEPTPLPAGAGESNAAAAALDRTMEQYQQSMETLVQRARQAGARQVILLGPIPVQPGLNMRMDGLGVNDMLAQLNKRVLEAARREHAGYIDMYSFAQAVLDAASKTEGEALAFDGIRPNDLGGVMLASIVLKGMGVEAEDLEPVAWAPIPPRKMSRVRNGLAIALKSPSLEASELSQALYVALLQHDQLFFRAWRNAGKSPSSGTRETALVTADMAWQKVDQTVRELFDPSFVKTENPKK